MALAGTSHIDIAAAGEELPAVHPHTVNVHHGGGVQHFYHHIAAELRGSFRPADQHPGSVGRIRTNDLGPVMFPFPIDIGCTGHKILVLHIAKFGKSTMEISRFKRIGLFCHGY